MEPEIIGKINELLSEYREKYMNPGHRKIRLDGFYWLVPVVPEKWKLWPDEAGVWPNDSWPHHRSSGVYFVLDAEMVLLYIGKAARLGSRLSAHFKYSNGRGSACEPRGDWKGVPALVAVVTVDEPFLAPSLEEFLIGRLPTATNKTWARREEEGA